MRQDPKDWNGMGYQLICSLPSDKRDTHYGEMFRANADLIAVAPELYEVLTAVVADIDEYERINSLSPSPGKPDCWQSVTRARAVLAKARDGR